MSIPNSWLNQRLGDPPRYRLDQCLGSGSFGDVFLAMDLRLGRRVAVKILKGALAMHRDLLIRFEREVALSVALESEHIVQVIDYGVALNEYPFYVMEYLQGQTLSQLLARQGRLPVEQAIAIVLQICAGLEVAHSGVTLWKNEATVAEPIKIIHRDLKPANIFLISTPLGEHVKILDFGIAKKLHTCEEAEPTQLTQAFLGTFRYAAPEQLKNAWKLDERADIYSLGMIFYEMLSGTDPFGISTQVSVQRLESAWAMAHTSVAPTPLRQQPNCQLFSAELEVTIMRCLAKCPRERFNSVAELRRLLQSIISSVNSQVEGPPTVLEASTPTESHLLISQQNELQNIQDTTIYRPIAQYVKAQFAADGTIFQSRDMEKSLPQEGKNKNLSAGINFNNEDIESQVGKPIVDVSSNIEIDQPSATHHPFPDVTIVQVPSPQTESSTPSDTTVYQPAQRNTQVNQDNTIFQTPASPNHRGQVIEVPKASEQHPQKPVSEGLLGQAKAWLQSSATNYRDRIRAQASAEVRYAAYRLLARLLPAGIGFAFGLASLSGAYFLFRGQSSHSPFKQIPSQIK